MNKKGFTLIELLAVIVVIALIIIIAAPNVTKVINGSKEDSQKVQQSTIDDALKTYITQNALTLGDDAEVCISDLKESGLLEDKVIYNTDTKEELKGCYSLTWNSEYNQYDYTYNKDSVKVTFNANGGVVNIPSKTVTIGQTYGTLPTPTREGYTFKGWNGKNLVNIADQNVSFTGKHYKEQFFDYELLPNTTYTLSFNYNVISSTNPIHDSVGYGSIVGKYNYDIYHSSCYSGIGRKKTTFTTSNSFNTSPAKIAFRLVRMGTSGNANVDISNIQLEIGSTATPYEPYYVTSLTNVTQAKDHTLTAIWEQNT